MSSSFSAWVTSPAVRGKSDSRVRSANPYAVAQDAAHSGATPAHRAMDDNDVNEAISADDGSAITRLT